MTERCSLSSITQDQITTIVKGDPNYKFGKTSHGMSSSQQLVPTERAQSVCDITSSDPSSEATKQE